MSHGTAPGVAPPAWRWLGPGHVLSVWDAHRPEGSAWRPRYTKAPRLESEGAHGGLTPRPHGLNLETAKALDLAIPQSILLRADEVIQ